MAAVRRSAYGRAASTRCWALRMREVAISSMARVIFMVDCTERIRRRTSRSFAPTVNPALSRDLRAAGIGRRPGPALELLRAGAPESLQGLLLELGERLGARLLEGRMALGGLEGHAEVTDGLFKG